MTANRLLLIDDDLKLAEMLAEYLDAEDIELTAIANGNEGLREAQRGDYDLIILDVMLPGMSGFDLLKRLRENGQPTQTTPVLMLTARGKDVDRIVGLEMGADDYLPKPFNPRELVARIKAVLRRTQAEDAEDVSTVELGPLRAELGQREAWLDGHALKLTNAEFVILFTLMRNAGEVVSREVLTRVALGRRLLPDDRSLDTHISNLRKKITQSTDANLAIRSIRGSGYVLVESEAPE